MKQRSALTMLRRRSEVFKALGHEDRMRIVDDLTRGERCVCELVQSVGSSWSTVSRHLSVLKAAGVVADEKRGLQVFYRIALPCVISFMACLDTARRGDADRATPLPQPRPRVKSSLRVMNPTAARESEVDAPPPGRGRGARRIAAKAEPKVSL